MQEISLLLLLFCVLFVAQLFPRRFLYENFASSNETQKFPACSYQTSSDYNVKKRELDVLFQKMEAISTDMLEGSGRVYKSIAVPYSTEQDIEPAAVLVGRCHKKAIRQRDIELAAERFQIRGEQLIKALSDYYPQYADSTRSALLSSISSLKSTMLNKCLKEQPRLDLPNGVRDPAFYEPPALESLRATSTFTSGQ